MIIVKLMGGLGNQMFQYATARCLAVENNTELLIDCSEYAKYTLQKYSLNNLNIVARLANKDELISVNNQRKYGRVIGSIFNRVNKHQKLKYYIEESLVYNNNVLILGDNVYLDGYFQSEDYFKHRRDTILADFHVKDDPNGMNKIFMNQMNIENSVSLHIRRGDYVNNSLTNKVHGTCSLGYYQSAVDYIAAKVATPIFYVFSDDKKWVKENLKLTYKTIYVDCNNADYNYEDLRLMSSCKHNIIANSSFSWWGAWLNRNIDKIVVAPKQWFAQNKPNNIVPETWIKL